MKYIRKVILENFQSHKYTEMEFDKYLNVIVGPSDHGKSAVIRGIKWALFNEPSGDFFIREGEKECSVTIEFNDNTKVKRYRSKSKNAYYLYDENGTEMIFEGFGTTVPQEIIDKILIRKVVLDGDTSNAINIGEQLEGPFLLSEKNSVRANAIGRLVGVHIIDDALKDTLKDSRNLNIKKKSHESSLENLQENLSEYNYLEDLNKSLTKLEKIRLVIYNNNIKLEKLVKISEKLYNVNEEISQALSQIKKLENLDQIIEIEKVLTKKIDICKFIDNRYNKLNTVNAQIKEDEKTLDYLKNIEQCKNSIENIEILSKRSNTLQKSYLNYKLLMDNMIKTKYQLNLLSNIEKVENNFIKINEKYLIYNKLSRLNKDLDFVNKSLSIGTVYIEKLSKIDYISNIEYEINQKILILKNLTVYNNKYKNLLMACTNEKANLDNLDTKLNEHLVKYQSLLTEIKVCPLCFSSIDKLKIDEIINNYR